MSPSRIAIIGASGYTGAELVRLASNHAGLRIEALVADRKAGMDMHEVFPGFRHLDLPGLVRLEDISFDGLDLVFCALPHATSQAVIKSLPSRLKIVDLSADFRLRNTDAYERWYGVAHIAAEIQREAVYGLTEFYREDIRTARVVACTGCNAATGLYALLPLAAARVIDPDDITIDLKTGVSGAGRGPKETSLHAEVSEGLQAYAVASHRHLGEFDQELGKAFGRPTEVTFVPHLVPQNRGILATVYVKGEADRVHSVLAERYANEPFVHVLPFGKHPSSRHVRGSNYVHIGVVADRKPGRAIVFSTLDNLTKGSSGQAVQNANLMLGHEESSGLTVCPVFP